MNISADTLLLLADLALNTALVGILVTVTFALCMQSAAEDPAPSETTSDTGSPES